MKIFPIHVPRKQYRGSKPSLRQRAAEYNRDATRLETYLNESIEKDPTPIQQYIYGFIAPDIGLPLDRVTDILFGVDCGSNGLTVAKSAEAWHAFLTSADRANESAEAVAARLP